MVPIRCTLGLNALNLFTAAVQTGFGPFFSVYLTEQGWSQVDIGFALSIGTASVLLLQLPAGGLVDMIHHKRFAIGLALLLIGVSALMLVATPTQGPVWAAQVTHAIGSCIMTPAIAALTLALCGHAGFSERLGINARYASIGDALAAGLLGALAYYISSRAVFIAAMLLVLPALATLPLFRISDSVDENDHPALLHPKKRRSRNHRPWQIYREPAFHVFTVAAVLFQFANAAMLPLALNELTKRTGHSGFVVSAAIIVPQIVVALFSPLVGRLAQSVGRRPLLLLGFTALPLRALLFVSLPAAVPLVAMQVLDGVSGVVFGLMIPLIAADLTRRTGFLNFAINSLALAGGLGATLSTTSAGWIADTMGAPAAFLGLALIGLLALLVIGTLMPETRPDKPLRLPPAVAAA
ncbi:MAG TPA: MFS transporter [Acetobacteraceae bacterium]|jgi:MFS family permease|nr:MFS transporter [Acetobacteraceae bacterium]